MIIPFGPIAFRLAVVAAGRVFGWGDSPGVRYYFHSFDPPAICVVSLFSFRNWLCAPSLRHDTIVRHDPSTGRRATRNQMRLCFPILVGERMVCFIRQISSLTAVTATEQNSSFDDRIHGIRRLRPHSSPTTTASAKMGGRGHGGSPCIVVGGGGGREQRFQTITTMVFPILNGIDDANLTSVSYSSRAYSSSSTSASVPDPGSPYADTEIGVEGTARNEAFSLFACDELNASVAFTSCRPLRSSRRKLDERAKVRRTWQQRWFWLARMNAAAENSRTTITKAS
jgi:hypothetical protein